MPIFGWIRDALGVHKDHIDKKKAQLDVKKLENEEREQSRLVKPATMADIEKYDPKYKKLKDEYSKSKSAGGKTSGEWMGKRGKDTGCLVYLLLVLLLIAVFSILR